MTGECQKGVTVSSLAGMFFALLADSGKSWQHLGDCGGSAANKFRFLASDFVVDHFDDVHIYKLNRCHNSPIKKDISLNLCLAHFNEHAIDVFQIHRD